MSHHTKLYKTLTKEQRKFVDERRMSTTLKVKQWLRFFGKMVVYDQSVDQRMKSLRGTMFSYLALALISLLLAGLMSKYVLVVTGLLLMKALSLFARRKQLLKRDVSNYMRLFLVPVLQVLREKAGSNAKFAATLDFRNPRNADPPEKYWMKEKQRNFKWYKPTYIVAKVVLLDGVRLEFMVSEDVKDYKWIKRSSHGNLSYKTKQKVAHRVLLKLTFSKATYKWLEGSNEQITIEDVGETYVAKQKLKIKKDGKDLILGVDDFFDAIGLMYQQFEVRSPSNDPNGSKIESQSNSKNPNDTNSNSLGYASAFGDFDYDGFDYRPSGEFATPDEEGATVFDS